MVADDRQHPRIDKGADGVADGSFLGLEVARKIEKVGHGRTCTTGPSAWFARDWPALGSMARQTRQTPERRGWQRLTLRRVQFWIKDTTDLTAGRLLTKK